MNALSIILAGMDGGDVTMAGMILYYIPYMTIVVFLLWNILGKSGH